MQTDLFQIPSRKNKTTFADPSFGSNKIVPVHRWVPWIAGFSSEFVKDVIAHELHGKGTVLDPFAGVGTTLVEAAVKGHDVIGFEINPYAALACEVKLKSSRIDPGIILETVHDMEAFCKRAQREGAQPVSTPPAGFMTRYPFYSKSVLTKVLFVQDFILTIKEELLQQLFRVAFASTMVSFSNYTYEPSLGTRRGAGRDDIVDAGVVTIVANKLRDMAEDMKWLRSFSNMSDLNAQVLRMSFFDCHLVTEEASVDLAITSPPYLNNYHYVRNTRPHLYWLGFADHPRDTKQLEHKNFGKYWQVVREKESIDLNFDGAPEGLIDQIEHLRKLNTHKGIYGGNGWANYTASYFNDCYAFVKGLIHILKPESAAYVVIGNSILQGEMIPVDEYLGQIAESAGLKLDGIYTPRAERVGNSIIKSNVRATAAKKSDALYEAVVVLRKPGP